MYFCFSSGGTMLRTASTFGNVQGMFHDGIVRSDNQADAEVPLYHGNVFLSKHARSRPPVRFLHVRQCGAAT